MSNDSRPKTFLIVLIPLLSLIGCGDGGERTFAALPAFCQEVMRDMDRFLGSFEDPADGRYGGTAVVGGIGEIPGGMNSLVSADHGAAQHQIFVNQMTLIRFDEAYDPEPYLARAWDVNEEETEVTFHLRDDVFWHDGHKTTAYDVEFTYRRATDPETGFPNAAFWAHYVPGPDGIEVVDSFTVKLEMRPHAEALDPWRALAIMPRHLLEDVPPGELRQHPFGERCSVGNGPFRFVEHRSDESWAFERNPAFPEELGGPPFLGRYVYRVVPEPSTLLTDLLTESVDLYLQPTADQFPRIEDAEHLRLLTFPFRDYVFAAWNSRRRQLEDPRVRRAIAHGVNRAQIVEAILGGSGSVANTGVPPFHWAYDEEAVDALPYDPERARELLEEAGWVDRDGDGIREDADGVRMELSVRYNTGNQERQEIAEIMQSQLRRVGIEVRPRAMEWATLVSEITDAERRDFDGFILAWVTEFKVDDTDLFHSSNSSAPYGWAGLEDEEVDRLLEQLQVTVDREDALPLWEAYQQRILELQPFTYIYFRERGAGLNERLRDVHMDARGEWVTISQWWIPEEERTGRPLVARSP